MHAHDVVDEEDELLSVLLDEEGFSVDRTQSIRPGERTEDSPLSFAQQRLWLLDQLAPGNPFYNIPSAWRLFGPLDVPALERCLSEIIRRHETLRTTFRLIEGQPVQVIAPATPLALPVVDLSRLPEAEREAAALRLAREEARRPFDLSRGPLLRATLPRLGAAEHVLLLTLHHIVSDGWSLGVLFRELAALYDAYAGGTPSRLSELPIQYADFAVWQRQWLREEVLETQLAYWRRQLAGLPTLELPADRPRPPAQNFRGGRHAFSVPDAQAAALKALSRWERATLFMTLLAAFKVLLHRYTGQQDIALGSPIAGRTRAETEGLIGFFANTLVLRTDLAGDPTFRELLGRVREVCLAAYTHQDLPFEKLVEALQPERDLSRNPLFQVMFTFQASPADAPRLCGLTVTPLELDRGTARFDLTLAVVERPDRLACRFEYSSDLLDAATIARMSGHFQTLLEGIVADPDRRLSELPLLGEAERHQLLVEWNDTAVDFPNRCIHELFEAQVERTPDAVAVVFEDRRLTYGDLNARANRLAHYLLGRGVRPEVLVGICLEPSLEMVIGLLGILKAGGAYVPLDATYPKARLAFMLDDARVALLLTRDRLADGFAEYDGRLVSLDADAAAIAREGAENPRSVVAPEHLAYVLYTSGSTGRPKAVGVEHRQVQNYSSAILRRLDLEPGASFAMVQPLTVDSCITTIFPPLVTGGCLHVVSRERAADAAGLGEYFRRHQIDCLKIAPSHLAALQHGDGPGQLMPRRRLVIGGEASRWEWVRALHGLAPDCTILNHYGPTEATVGVLTYTLEREPADRWYSTTPLGRPLANMRIYLLDRHRQPVPVGVAGELYIGGDGVARGYLRRPRLTAERFLPDPFGAKPGTRLYRTGDLARYRPDGTIEFLGRLDDQVKAHGFRIELGEIEAVLGEHAAVRAAIVGAPRDDSGDVRLVAYVVPRRGQAPTAAELRSFLRAQLPPHMVPSAFVLLNTLPLTPHGKVDRNALPAPDPARPEHDSAVVAPRTRLEGHLTAIWEELLGVQPIGVTDDFFELGGHSLLATQVMARVRDALQVELPLRCLFEASTVAGLAQAIAERQLPPSETTR